MSFFDSIKAAEPDPIFGVAAKFSECKKEPKYLLSVGVYRTEEGKPYVFPSVSKAEDKIIHKHFKDYLPMAGYAPFIERARELLWSKELLKEIGPRVCTVQSCAGTGALFLASRFTNRQMRVPKVLLSDPMWPNYLQIFGDNGHELGFYPWVKDGGLDLKGCTTALEEAPNGCLVVMQACAHNPTGVDPTPDQWEKIIKVCDEKRHIMCFDFAYMGFGSGDLDEDARVVRNYAASGRECFVCFSFSKCMGLYGERTGVIHAVCKDAETAGRVGSQLALIGRQSWSVCPQNGALIAAEVLGDPDLKAQWKEELGEAAGRVINIRQKLCDLLEEKTGRSWEFLRRQRGMFANTGLTPEQVEKLGDVHGVFLTGTGRLTVPAVNNKNVAYIAQAIADVLKGQ